MYDNCNAVYLGSSHTLQNRVEPDLLQGTKDCYRLTARAIVSISRLALHSIPDLIVPGSGLALPCFSTIARVFKTRKDARLAGCTLFLLSHRLHELLTILLFKRLISTWHWNSTNIVTPSFFCITLRQHILVVGFASFFYLFLLSVSVD